METEPFTPTRYLFRLAEQVPALATFGIVIGFVVHTFVGFLQVEAARATEVAREVAASQVRAAELHAQALGELRGSIRNLASSVRDAGSLREVPDPLDKGR